MIIESYGVMDELPYEILSKIFYHIPICEIIQAQRINKSFKLLFKKGVLMNEYFKFIPWSMYSDEKNNAILENINKLIITSSHKTKICASCFKQISSISWGLILCNCISVFSIFHNKKNKKIINYINVHHKCIGNTESQNFVQFIHCPVCNHKKIFIKVYLWS